MNQLERPPTCPSDLTFDLYATGELSPAQGAAFEAHREGCPRCQSRQRSLDAQHRAFLAQASSMPALGTLAGSRPVPRRKKHERAWRVAATASASLVLAAAALLMIETKSGTRVEPGTRTKGTARIAYFVKRGERVARGQPAEPLYPGELVRFTYSSERAAYLAVLNLDARRAAVYFPAGAAEATRVEAGNEIALDFSVRLDDAVGEEVITAVFCPGRFALAPVLEALEHERRLPVLPRCEIDRLILNKQARP